MKEQEPRPIDNTIETLQEESKGAIEFLELPSEEWEE